MVRNIGQPKRCVNSKFSFQLSGFNLIVLLSLSAHIQIKPLFEKAQRVAAHYVLPNKSGILITLTGIRQIVENAGVEGSIVVSKLLEKSGNYGFDAQTEEYVDMIAAGIIDPTKVVRVALQDAASVASLLITTEAMIAEKPKNAAPAMPGGGGMGGGGMGGMDF